jgi:hypothetical protein
VAEVLGPFSFNRGPFSFNDPSARGTMTFTDNGVAIPNCVNVPVFFDFATCTTAYRSTSGSPHAIIATYSGDPHHGAGTSNTVSETVLRANPTNRVTNSSPTTFGGPLTFTATLSGPGATPTGAVTWKVTAPSGVSSCASTATLSNGAATCTITASKAGNYSASDTYGGDANYTSSGSNTDSVNVIATTATDTLKSSQNPTTVGTAVTYSATVTGTQATPTGTVTFEDNGSAITSCGNKGVVTLVHATATCTVTYPSTTGSPHQVTAPYNGDATYAPVNSNTVSETVNKATPTNKVTNSSLTKVGSTITFTAAVSGSGVTPTGTVTWSVSTPSGVASCSSTATLSNGAATCVITASKTGNYSVSDSYGGDANYTSSGSNTDSVSVSAGRNDHFSAFGGNQP